MFSNNSLADLAVIRSFQRKRISSHDPTGGNHDYFEIEAGKQKIIFEQHGPGCIKHIWMTMRPIKGEHFWLRNVIIRFWWDHETKPSVECPIGDFFGLGHAERQTFTAAPVQMSPRWGRSFNCWWPMPFKEYAKVEIDVDLKKGAVLHLFNYFDFELYEKFPMDSRGEIGYFHAQFRKNDYKTDQWYDRDSGKHFSWLGWQQSEGNNTLLNGGYDNNHIILEAKGKGHYVGCNINIDNRPRLNFNWPGEGDDMIWIDDDLGKEPTLVGTGTEDYVNTAFCPGFEDKEVFNAPYHGVIKGGGFLWTGKISYYRYHILDPIVFDHQIKVSIEHGHDNHRGDIWESTAYWYQVEPHEPFPELASKKIRIPRKNHKSWIIMKWILKKTLKYLSLGMLFALILKYIFFWV